MSTISIVNSLKQSDIFFQFTPTQLELVANLCQEVVFQKDDLIFRENSSSKELYVIVQGEVDIFVDPSLISSVDLGSENKVITTLRRGQSFGEIALVDEGLRSASIDDQRNMQACLVPVRDGMRIRTQHAARKAEA